MTFGGSSAPEVGPPVARPAVLSGPVAICVDRPLLSLDRSFTYELTADLGAGVGSLVQVPFHGKATRGWVLEPTEDVPARILRVRKVVSPVRAFDPARLELLRWVSERYVAPLATVVGRAVPPRVAGEEDGRVGVGAGVPAAGVAPIGDRLDAGPLAGYRDGDRLLEAIGRGAGAFIVRPAPEDEALVAVDAVGACLRGGRRAVLVVPEASPVPATARAVLDAFGDRAVAFLGGDKRTRYRTWLDVAEGRYDVVVGTRPAVFAPVDPLGLLFVSRESHAAHREERAPYFHVRDVAVAAAERAGAVCVLSALCPSAEATASALPVVAAADRRWPPVEVVRPGPEGRAPRLVRALGAARRGFVFAPLPGSGVAQVCRTCGEPAACASCGGMLREEESTVSCVVCGAPGRCRACGGTRFGVRPGGAERVEAWAGRIAPVPVRRLADGEAPHLPAPDQILIGGPDDVRDLGVGDLELVAILDADLAARRPGVAARERSLATWMEAAGWARPHGRVIIQASTPNDPAIQALVRGNPDRFHADERRRRADAGLPVGSAVFRISGHASILPELEAFEPSTLLVTAVDGRTVCLLALDPRHVPALGALLRELAGSGLVERVEAEPHL